MSLPEKYQYYTYADYYAWDDGERWELIDGIPTQCHRLRRPYINE